MTVKALIAKLKKFDGDLEVLVDPDQYDQDQDRMNVGQIYEGGCGSALIVNLIKLDD